MPVIQIGKPPEAIREYRAPEVKDAHDTLYHNLRGPPPQEGGGRPTMTARRAERGTEGNIPEYGVIPVTQGQG